MSEDMFSKMCDVCNAQPAMLFFRTFNGSTVGEQGLCPQCALKRFSEGHGVDLGIGQTEILNTINEMRHILTDIAGHINKIADTPQAFDTESLSQSCNACGHSISDITKFGKAGCSLCYSEFSDIIKERHRKNSFGTKHHGHIPTRFRQEYFKNIELEKLKIKLHALLREEAYEEAAKVSKRISKLEASFN